MKVHKMMHEIKCLYDSERMNETPYY